MAEMKPPRKVTCPSCSSDFAPNSSSSKWCSSECRLKSKRKGFTCSRCFQQFSSDTKGRKVCDSCKTQACLAPGCSLDPSKTTVPFTKGYCNPHYLRLMSHGDPLKGGKSPNVRKAIDHSDGTRTCSKCQKRKLLADYYQDQNGSKGRRASCKACVNNKMRTYYLDNVEEKKSKTREIRRKNLYKIRARDMLRYEAQKDKRLALVESQVHIRRARRNQAPFDNGITRIALRKLQGDLCAYCGVSLNFVRARGRVFSGTDATIEHRLPLSRGGRHTWDNVVLACRDCNLSKGQKTEAEFEKYQLELLAAQSGQPPVDRNPSNESRTEQA